MHLVKPILTTNGPFGFSFYNTKSKLSKWGTNLKATYNGKRKVSLSTCYVVFFLFFFITNNYKRKNHENFPKKSMRIVLCEYIQ